MTKFYSTFAKRALFKLEAERAHALSIAALKSGLHPQFDSSTDPRLAISLAGLEFPNPLGMAAGYDKNAEVPNALLKMGFGHAEIGTVTPKPQPGNPTPRIFRLPEDQAVINRLGFNSKGHSVCIANLKNQNQRQGVLGVNIGANKSSADFGADYVQGIHALYEFADYFTVNISSPNTPGLRALQGTDPLTDLLNRVSEARAKQRDKYQRYIPIFLKIAPDLEEAELDDIAKVLQASDFDALIVSNTTLSRTGLKSHRKTEIGGLSGRPIFERSTIVLAKMRERLGKEFPVIGVGGISDGHSALTKIRAGAHLVQLYTGLIYGGPNLPRSILRELSKHLDKERLSSISEIRGSDAEYWAQKSLPSD